MFTKVTTIINNKNYAIMKNLTLVWLKNKPCRVFSTDEKAFNWMKKMCDNYPIDMQDFTISDILYYE